MGKNVSIRFRVAQGPVRVRLAEKLVVKFGFGLDLKTKSGLSQIEMSVNLISCQAKSNLPKISGSSVKLNL